MSLRKGLHWLDLHCYYRNVLCRTEYEGYFLWTVTLETIVGEIAGTAYYTTQSSHTEAWRMATKAFISFFRSLVRDYDDPLAHWDNTK